MSSSRQIQAIEWVKETTFETDPGAGYVRLDYLDQFDLPAMIDMPGAGVHYGLGKRRRRPGTKGNGSFTLRLPLRGTGTAADANTSATGAQGGTIGGGDFASIMSASGHKLIQTAAQGSQISATGATGAVINVDTGEGVQFTAGGGVLVDPTAGAAEWGFVISKATDALTCSQSFQNNAVENDNVYNTSTYVFKTQVGELAVLPSYTLLVHTGDGIFGYHGCAVVLRTVRLRGSEMGEVEIEVFYSSHSYNTMAADPAALSATTQTGLNFINGSNSPAYMADAAAYAAMWEFRPQFTVSPIHGMSGANGRTGWQITDMDPQVTAEVAFADATYATHMAGTLWELLLAMGNTAGASAAIYAPRAQIITHDAVDMNGAVGSRVTVQLTEDAANSRYPYHLAIS